MFVEFVDGVDDCMSRAASQWRRNTESSGISEVELLITIFLVVDSLKALLIRSSQLTCLGGFFKKYAHP